MEKSKQLEPLSVSIRRYRETAGLSQEQLAEISGFDRTYISMLECGKRNPSLLNLLRISGALKISISTLLEAYNGIKSKK